MILMVRSHHALRVPACAVPLAAPAPGSEILQHRKLLLCGHGTYGGKTSWFCELFQAILQKEDRMTR